MPSLQVRSLPAEIYDSLNLRAQDEHRSIAQQAIISLNAGLGSPMEQKKRRQQLLRELLEDPPVISGDYPSPAELIREDRDR